LERIAKEDEDVALAQQANELGEIARQQTEELQASEEAAPVEEVSEAPVEEVTAPEEPIVEAPESPAIVEESPVEESPAVVEEAVVESEEAAPAEEE
jgi:hypothetical protein